MVKFLWVAWLVCVMLAGPGVSPANEAASPPGSSLLPSVNYLARIGKNSPEELEQALLRIEQLLVVEAELGQFDPVVMVLHGPEVAIFLRDKYPEYRHIVDIAAKLTAFGVLDIRVCETRMAKMNQPLSQLMPFVSTVVFGPAEVERLVTQESYVNF